MEGISFKRQLISVTELHRGADGLISIQLKKEMEIK